jgi:hypothetical protein
MPQNPKTGKAVRRALTDEEVLEFRLKQAKYEEESRAEVKRGKRRARDSPGEPEGSGSVPSPLAQLEGLGALTLDGGGSSVDNTPGEKPTVLLHPPSAPKTREASRDSAGKSASDPTTLAATVEVPGPSQLFEPAHQASPDVLPEAEGRSNAMRLLAIESRLDELEKWVHKTEKRLDKLGK